MPFWICANFTMLPYLCFPLFYYVSWSLLEVTSRFCYNFYPNVTTLRSGICYHKSVCLSPVCLSVCNVRESYSGGCSFRQYFFVTVYLSHRLTSVQNFTETVLYSNPSVGSVKRKRGIKIERWWTYRRLYLIKRYRIRSRVQLRTNRKWRTKNSLV